MFQEGISVIICCYNSEFRIKETLLYLLNQKFNIVVPWEIIIVDNNSKDKTIEIAANLLSLNPAKINYKIVEEKNQGLIFARKKGISESKFGLLCFVDDDNWLNEFYLETAFNIFRKNELLAVVGGLCEPVFENNFIPEWFNNFKHVFAVDRQSNGDVTDTSGFVIGAGCVIRKTCWNYIVNRGFECYSIGRKGNSVTSGEDVEICLTMKMAGYKIFFDDSLKLKHFLPQSRLNLNYVKKYYKGNGETYLLLDAYKFFANNNFLPYEKLKLPFWLDKLIFKIKDFPKHFVGHYFNSKKDINYYNSISYFSELIAIIKNYKKINSIYLKIFELKNKLNAFD